MSKLIVVGALLMSLGVSGCAGISHAMQYEGTEIVRVQTEADNWRIFDKPEEGRLMITPSLGESAAGGFQEGITLGIIDASTPKPVYQEAVEKHLAQTGRAHCKVVDGYVILKPQWEFKYECPTPGAATAPPA